MLLVLASGSPYRKAQLTSFGIPFRAESPRVDEDFLKTQGPADLEELTRYLALKKAESLREAFPEAIILGSDQLAEVDGERLDKPGTEARALAQLQRLRGREHRLLTSIALIHRDRTVIRTETTRLILRAASDEDLRAYVKIDQPLDCAGSYKIERGGLALIERVDGRDPSAIQGLPLIHLTEALLELGFSPAHLWRQI